MFIETAIAQRERHKQELRRIILDAARRIFVEEGYESFSMRKLAQRIHYSPGSIYLHFKNKRELFHSLVEESFSKLHEGMVRLKAIEKNSDPVALLRKGLRGYVRFGLSYPNDYRFAFLISPPGEKRPQKVHAPFEALRQLIRVCVKEGYFHPIDVETASQDLWAIAHGVTSLLIQRSSFPWVPKERLIATVIDKSIDSFLAAPAQSRTKRLKRSLRRK